MFQECETVYEEECSEVSDQQCNTVLEQQCEVRINLFAVSQKWRDQNDKHGKGLGYVRWRSSEGERRGGYLHLAVREEEMEEGLQDATVWVELALGCKRAFPVREKETVALPTIICSTMSGGREGGGLYYTEFCTIFSHICTFYPVLRSVLKETTVAPPTIIFFWRNHTLHSAAAYIERNAFTLLATLSHAVKWSTYLGQWATEMAAYIGFLW